MIDWVGRLRMQALYSHDLYINNRSNTISDLYSCIYTNVEFHSFGFDCHNSDQHVEWSAYRLDPAHDQRRVSNCSAPPSRHLAWLWRWRVNSFKKTESLAQRHHGVCVGCELNSDQALRLLGLKGHVRVRNSTLRRRKLTRSEWILVY